MSEIIPFAGPLGLSPMAQHLRQLGWRVANSERKRDGADFLVSSDEDGEHLLWVSNVARHELLIRSRGKNVDDEDVATCWREFRPRAKVAAERAAFIAALWETPEGKRLKVSLMWTDCGLAVRARCEMVMCNTARQQEPPPPPTPTLDAFGEILLTMSITSEQRAAEHLAWLDEVMLRYNA